MGRYRSPRPEEVAAGQVTVQAVIVRSAKVLAHRSAALLESVDPLKPFSVDVAAETSDLLAAADDAATTVRQNIVKSLAGIYSHQVLAEIVEMSSWWVGKVLREAHRP